MKPTHLIWVLALAGVALACNSGPPITNAKPPIDPGTGGTTGTGGTSGTGGLGEGACTNDADQAVYEDLTYTDAQGIIYTGTEAASAIGSDCIFGSADSDPVLAGCGTEAGNVVACFSGGCDQPTIDALATCVAMCTQDATGLSDECMACTGDTVACGAAFCTSQCVSDTEATICVDCRCNNGCTPDFDECTGLPSSGDCG
jgi:hypothetical protein